MIKTRKKFFVLLFVSAFVFGACDLDWLDENNAEMAERLRSEIHHCGQAFHRNKHFEAAAAVYASEHGRSPAVPASVTFANLVRDKHLTCLKNNVNTNFTDRNITAEAVMQQEDSGRVVWIMTGTVTVNDKVSEPAAPATLILSAVTDTHIPPRITTFTITRTY